jgi:hypothetical protein
MASIINIPSMTILTVSRSLLKYIPNSDAKGTSMAKSTAAAVAVSTDCVLVCIKKANTVANNSVRIIAFQTE